MSIDETIAAAAVKHHGAFARAEVSDVVDARALKRRVRAGALGVLSSNVLRVTGVRPTDEQRVAAATLDVPGGAVAASFSAGWLWEIPGFALRDVVVAARREQHRSSPLAIVHHPRLWLPEHTTVRRGIEVTSLALTIYDLAGRIPRGRLLWIVDRVGNQCPSVLQQLHDMLPMLAESGRNGITAMRWVLTKNPPGVRPPGSGNERRFEDLIEAARITGLRRQVDYGGHAWIGRVDYFCDVSGVIFEIDSESHHTSPADVAADEVRDAAMIAAGATDVVRIWTELLWKDPPRVIGIVRQTRKKFRDAA